MYKWIKINLGTWEKRNFTRDIKGKNLNMRKMDGGSDAVRIAYGVFHKSFVKTIHTCWEIFKDVHSVFLGNPNVPAPKNIVCTQWRSNNFTRGSYTYIPVGVDGQVMDVLAEPLVGMKNPNKVTTFSYYSIIHVIIVIIRGRCFNIHPVFLSWLQQ